MMAEVPKADLVVTNPTHYAVALKYHDGEMSAPRVVAKGTDLVALRIRELAREHGVPVLEAPPLARALYRHCRARPRNSGRAVHRRGRGAGLRLPAAPLAQCRRRRAADRRPTCRCRRSSTRRRPAREA